MLLIRDAARQSLSPVTLGVCGLSGLMIGISLYSAASKPEEPPLVFDDAIVLCHGFMGWKGLGHGSYFRGVRAWLRQRGVLVLQTEVSPVGSIDLRAKELAKQIQHLKRVHLIGHSMGGLDARRVAQMLDNVISVSTISTPHRGSSLATGGLELPDVVAAMADLSPEKMVSFNQAHPPMDTVAYFSVAGSEKLGPLHPLFPAQKILHEKEGGRNDGLVSVESAIFGEFLGEYPTLNHWSEIGWTTDTQHFPLYEQLFQNLVDRGLLK